jgi:hypothetical protein
MKYGEKNCGNCCWFCNEDCDGDGMCMIDYPYGFQSCVDSGVFCEFVSREEMRHHMAVLLQESRFLKDENVPSIYNPPYLDELEKAIDFSYRFIKTFSKL